jgi:hypothetical protein
MCNPAWLQKLYSRVLPDHSLLWDLLCLGLQLVGKKSYNPGTQPPLPVALSDVGPRSPIRFNVATARRRGMGTWVIENALKISSLD